MPRKEQKERKERKTTRATAAGGKSAPARKGSDKRTQAEIASEIEKNLAEAEMYRASAQESLATARKAEIEREFGAENKAHIHALRLAQEAQTRHVLRQEQEQLAHPRFHNAYHFTQPVREDSIRACMAQLDIWHHKDPNCPIEIIFSSPGGNIVDGMALYDYIRLMSNRGHKITTGALGYAASMAAILLQAGDERRMGREAYLLIHQGSFGTGGNLGEVLDTVDWIKKMQDRILDIFATKAKLPKNEIKKRWERKDWWLDSTEAVKLGFVDGVME